MATKKPNPKKVRDAGRILNDPKSSKKAKSEAAKILKEHQDKEH